MTIILKLRHMQSAGCSLRGLVSVFHGGGGGGVGGVVASPGRGDGDEEKFV